MCEHDAYVTQLCYGLCYAGRHAHVCTRVHKLCSLHVPTPEDRPRPRHMLTPQHMFRSSAVLERKGFVCAPCMLLSAEFKASSGKCLTKCRDGSRECSGTGESAERPWVLQHSSSWCVQHPLLEVPNMLAFAVMYSDACKTKIILRISEFVI